MDITDREIREALEGGSIPAGACVGAEELDAYFSDRLPKERVEEIRSHLAACARCLEIARELNLFMESFLNQAAGSAGAGARSFYRNPLFHLAAAASVVLGIWFFREKPFAISPPPASEIRGSSPESGFELITPKGEWSLPPTSLEWKAITMAESYEVELRDVELKVLWRETGVRLTAIPLPPNAARMLQSGKEYGWRVTAVLAGGRRVVSPLETFRLR